MAQMLDRAVGPDPAQEVAARDEGWTSMGPGVRCGDDATVALIEKSGCQRTARLRADVRSRGGSCAGQLLAGAGLVLPVG
jgi:hypothetical protein